MTAATAPRQDLQHSPAPVVRGLLLRWLVSFVGFPIGGLVAIAIGPVDDYAAALLGGLGSGVVIGGLQWVLLRGPVRLSAWWGPATGVGLALGLTIGSRLVDYDTALIDLIMQGAVCGTYVGLAQGFVLRRVIGARLATLWSLSASLTWPLGWVVTTAFGVGVDQQFSVFGASGALAYTAASAAVMIALLRRRATDGPTSPLSRHSDVKGVRR